MGQYSTYLGLDHVLNLLLVINSLSPYNNTTGLMLHVSTAKKTLSSKKDGIQPVAGGTQAATRTASLAHDLEVRLLQFGAG